MRTDGARWRLARDAGRAVFGDRVGLTLWLGLLVALALGWRVGFFIQADEYGVANTLVAVADGGVAIERIHYSLTLGGQTGLSEYGGRLYGRNYGQVALAVPLVWALRAATTVVPLHLVIAGAWALTGVAFASQLAAVTGDERHRRFGSLAALVGFALVVRSGAALDPALLELAALQASTLAAAAFAGVLCYRLVGLFHERSVAVAGGIAVALALPVGFWAAIPKRHVLVATLLLAVVYCFARSRTDGGRAALVAIACAYAATGLIAWVHAFEGFFAMATLGVVDLATGGLRDRRRVAVVTAGVLVGLAPMFVTNLLISANPFQPPRMLPGPGSGAFDLGPSGEVASAEAGTAGDPASSGPDSGGSADGGDSVTGGDGSPGAWTGILSALSGPVAQAAPITAYVVSSVVDGVAVLGDPGRLGAIFVRSGYVEGIRYRLNGFEAIELTVLESAPLLAGVAAAPAILWRRVRDGRGSDRSVPTPWSLSPVRQVDLLVASLAAVLVVVYLPLLPLFSQITVRYVMPTFPLALYGVARIPAVREAIRRDPRRLTETYATTVLVGVVAAAAALGWLDVAVGEAAQFHALVNLGTGAAFAAAVAGRTLAPDRVPVRWVTASAAVAAAATTAFVVLARIEYFQHGPAALGLTRWIADLLPVL